jgi:hypothetical protein
LGPIHQSFETLPSRLQDKHNLFHHQWTMNGIFNTRIPKRIADPYNSLHTSSRKSATSPELDR